ncbi:hypothetical protein HOY82DRAFT_649257 [Tuber indicum]|nr:hypothetical protein HOY82DRAFT_649257 [Tuber indicum]
MAFFAACEWHTRIWLGALNFLSATTPSSQQINPIATSPSLSLALSLFFSAYIRYVTPYLSQSGVNSMPSIAGYNKGDHRQHCSGHNIRQKKQTNPKRETSPEVITEEETTSTLKKQTGDLKYWTAYSKASQRDAENRLGIKFANFEKVGVPVSRMLELAKPEIEGLTEDQLKKTKETVYENIVRYIDGEVFNNKVYGKRYGQQVHPMSRLF